MELQRKEDLSVYYWLEDLFKDIEINLEDGFPVNELVIPTISVEAKLLERIPFEMGSRTGIEPRLWFIDVFAENKSRRDEFGYRILNNIEDNIPVYDYDEGFPPSVSPSQLGVLIPRNIKMEIIRVIPELVTKLYWRATISFVAVYSNI
jgi:hypothetical protein